VRFFVYGAALDDAVASDAPASAVAAAKAAQPAPEYSFSMKALLLTWCTVGLLGSYLSWGLIQERIMTTEYTTGRFESSNFLVFCNRALALCAAATVIKLTEQPRLKAPFFEFSFTSLSNVLSSWCQLEALKYISFPTQVLAKSSKMIPVMLMGKVISKKTYPWYDYGVAVVIAAGVGLFMTAQKSGSSGGDETETTTDGIFLILSYLTFDSFTSQWQDRLFTAYKPLSSYQMMLGVNAFSGMFTLASILWSGELVSSLAFLGENPDAVWHIALFSLAGATGQMFIFFTIKTFGALVFTVVMTTRQLIAILLSIAIYGHTITQNGVVGAVLVFSAIGYRIYKKYEEQRAKREAKRRAGLAKVQAEGETVVRSSKTTTVTAAHRRR